MLKGTTRGFMKFSEQGIMRCLAEETEIRRDSHPARHTLGGLRSEGHRGLGHI